MALHCILLAIPGLALANSERIERPMPAIVRDVAKTLGFDEGDLTAVWDGEIVSRSLDTRSDKELAIGVMMRLSEKHPDFYERARTGQFFEIDQTILQAREISKTSTGPAAFIQLRLEASELRKLGRASPNEDFNLTERESKQLRRANRSGEPAVLEAYRGLLAERLREYRANGIDGIASYARGRHPEARPAEDLRHAIASLGGLAERCPSFYGSFAGFPRKRDPAVAHRFFWAVQQVRGRPTVTLSHWALQLHEEFAIIGQRQFYVSHGYDALQIVVGAFAIGNDESLVFYVNRTYTDQVTGFGSSIARIVGNKMMEREVVHLFREIRRSATTEDRTR